MTTLFQQCTPKSDGKCVQCGLTCPPPSAQVRRRVCRTWLEEEHGISTGNKLRRRQRKFLPNADLRKLSAALTPCNCPKGMTEQTNYALRTLNSWPTPEIRVNGDWAVGVTTAPRLEGPISHCIQSLLINGWNPIVFAEPGSEIVPGVETRINAMKKGAWENWKHAAHSLLATGAKKILIVQDDTVILPGSRHYLDRVQWPKDAAFISLYRSRRQTPEEPPGLREVSQSFEKRKWSRAGIYWGACAWAFEARALRAILRTKMVRTWKGVNFASNPDRKPDEVKHIDNVIPRAARALKLKWYAPTPSAAQHVAQHSTIMFSPKGKPLGNLGDRSASTLIGDWSFGAEVQKTGDEEYDDALASWRRIFGRAAYPLAPGLWKELKSRISPGTQVLEFGSGVSTLLMRNAGATVTSIEQDPVIAAVSGAQYSPLNAEGWYSWKPEPNETHDIILIDGPANRGRELVLPYLKDLCHDNTVILVDDTHRDAESKLANSISQELDFDVNFSREGGRGWATLSAKT